MPLATLASALSSSISAGAAAGLLSSAHCAGMCGPLSSAVCQRSSGGAPLRYQAGRALSYGFLGSIAGQAGLALSSVLARALPGWTFPVLVALLLAAWGIALLLRSFARSASSFKARERLFQIRTRPASNTGATPIAARANLALFLLRVVPRDAFVFGLVSALLPCGALAAALAIAAAAGSPLAGALAMLAFALTTGVAVAASSYVLERATAARSARVARGIAFAMLCAALFLGVRPFLAHAGSTQVAAAHARCH